MPRPAPSSPLFDRALSDLARLIALGYYAGAREEEIKDELLRVIGLKTAKPLPPLPPPSPRVERLPDKKYAPPPTVDTGGRVLRRPVNLEKMDDLD